ncbi:MAG: hypothetical protein Q4C37_00935 [Bacteroidales bacterium]|nr:hypothetical protein [Bacteroidales bacterium]
MDDTTFISAGILLAAAYNPDIDTPEKKAIIYLEEIFVIHHESILGVSGKLKAIIPFINILFMLFVWIYLMLPTINNKYIIAAIFDMINAKRYPFIPKDKRLRNTYDDNRRIAAAIIPLIAYSFTFPRPRVN